MDELISRQAVKELAHNQVREKYCSMALKEDCDFYIKLADSIIDLLPTIQPKKGKWIIKDDTERFIAQCNCCRYIEDSRRIKNFCPNCGADMREETT